MIDFNCERKARKYSVVCLLFHHVLSGKLWLWSSFVVDHGFARIYAPQSQGFKLTFYPNLPHLYLSLTLQALKTFRPLCIESYLCENSCLSMQVMTWHIPSRLLGWVYVFLDTRVLWVWEGIVHLYVGRRANGYIFYPPHKWVTSVWALVLNSIVHLWFALRDDCWGGLAVEWIWLVDIDACLLDFALNRIHCFKMCLGWSWFMYSSMISLLRGKQRSSLGEFDICVLYRVFYPRPLVILCIKRALRSRF